MQLAGTYGKAVVVQVEPDLWGYLQQRAAGGGPSTLTASVASSGFADVAGIPNTAQGFGYALLKLRDLYGPNVTMAVHASPWSSGIDIASNTSATVNAAAEADKTAAFLNSAGIASNPYGSTWDVVFNDVDDHDAGWWEAQGNPSRWFDPTNTKFPNFTRYLSWVAELHVMTGRPQVAWQVPVGNQYYLTMNNTCGHYQDNLAAYFTSRPTDLYNAGLIAVLFGAGNGCQTNNTDAQNDGVTNNGGVATSDTAGGCTACNTHVSASSDDDGGFLRMAVGNYYQTGGGLTGVWTSLGGIVTSGPDASASGAQVADVFARGSDMALWHRTWNGTSWGPWHSMGGVITADPAAVSWGPNHIDVFVRGNDNGLYQSTWNGATWSGWTSLGGVLSSSPAASSQGPNSLDVFVRGSDKALYERSWNGSSWNGWHSLGGILTSDPSAVSWGPGHVDVFVRGQDSALWQRTLDSGTWGGWRSLGGILHSAAAASSCTVGHLDVYVAGADNSMYGSGWNGTSWSGWRRLGGSWSSSPGAVCIPTTTQVHLFARGLTDNALWEDVITGS
jgi:hypothetical protein